MFVYKDKEFDLDNIELSFSSIKLIYESIKTYLENKLKPFKETDAIIFGKIYHTLVLEPEKFAERFFFMPEEPAFPRKNEKMGIPAVAEQREKWKQEIEETNQGKTAIKQEVFDQAKAMLQELFKHPLATALLTSDGNEYEQRYDFEVNKQKYKTFLDLVNIEKGFIVDLKTIASASTDKIEKSIKDYMYYLQDFLYCSAATAKHKKPFVFHFIFQETVPPYDVQVINLNDAWQELAYERWHEALKKWEVFKADPKRTYTGRCAGITTLKCPVYLSKRFKNREQSK
jgi:hypothetical protein